MKTINNEEEIRKQEEEFNNSDNKFPTKAVKVKIDNTLTAYCTLDVPIYQLGVDGEPLYDENDLIVAAINKGYLVKDILNDTILMSKMILEAPDVPVTLKEMAHNILNKRITWTETRIDAESI